MAGLFLLPKGIVSAMTATFELTSEILTPVVRRLLDDSAANVSEFSIHALKPGLGNPTSLGVYRVKGTAGQPFSLVVKHLANGLPMMDASEPTHWNYWKREIAFFESPLAERIPRSIGYPKYLGQSTLADGTALFWNADLGDLEKSKWTWDQCLNATRLVAELNSIDSRDLDDYEWLNRTQVEGWDEFREGFFVPMHPKVVELAKAKPSTAAALEVFGPFLPRQDFIGQIMHSGRQTFVHGDFNLNNLVPVSNEAQSIIALDWQLAGVGRVGGEIASIFNTARELGVITGTSEEFEELCEVYTERFNELNEPIELNEVRLAAAATGFFIIAGVGFFFVQPEPGNTVEQNEAKVQSMVDDFSFGPLMVYASVLTDLTQQR